MNGDFGWVARILDLMGGDRQQCPNGWGEGLWALEEVLDGRGEAQVPANRAERDGTYGGFIPGTARIPDCQRKGRIRRMAVPDDGFDDARRCRERRRARCPGGPSQGGGP